MGRRLADPYHARQYIIVGVAPAGLEYPLGTDYRLPMGESGAADAVVRGIPLVRGRAFTDADRDGAGLVVIVSQSVARRFWPGQNPIGKHLRFVRAGAPSDAHRSRGGVASGVMPERSPQQLAT